MINIYIILTTSANLVVGMVNLLSICQAAFYGIGAYITALALMVLGLPLIPALLLAMSLTSILGYIIGFASLRLKGDYFVLATLGFQMIIYNIMYNWISLTKGPYGIPGIPSPEMFIFIHISGELGFFILSLLLMSCVLFLFYRLIHSPFGRALKGIRDDEISMLVLGRNVALLKRQAFTIASAFSALSGFIFAIYITYINPTSFSLDESIFIVSAVLIGGTGNLKGPMVGAIFVVLIPELLRFIGLPDNLAANMRMIIYGLTLCLFMYFRPQGIAGQFKF
jgi:branched-chain amino acid transport system permease protein